MAKLDQTQLNLSKTTDANGWTVYDYGTWKQWVKVFTGSISSTIAAYGIYNCLNFAAAPGNWVVTVTIQTA